MQITVEPPLCQDLCTLPYQNVGLLRRQQQVMSQTKLLVSYAEALGLKVSHEESLMTPMQTVQYNEAQQTG